MSKRTPSNLDEAQTGDYLFHLDTGEVVEVMDIDAEWNEDDGTYDGTVELRVADGGDETFEEPADDFDFELVESEYIPVSERLLREPGAVLREFGEHEVGNYISRLGDLHDYNGIDGVSVVADLRAASFLSAHRSGPDRWAELVIQDDGIGVALYEQGENNERVDVVEETWLTDDEVQELRNGTNRHITLGDG